MANLSEFHGTPPPRDAIAPPFSQADEDHRNNQLVSLYEQLSSLHVQMEGEHGRGGYGRGGQDE